MASSSSSDDSGPRIEEVDKAEDMIGAFHCLCESFGKQTRDTLWMSHNPGWDSPEGKARAVERMVERWRSRTKDWEGRDNTMFLKATVPDPHEEEGSRRVIAGFAVWVQASAVEGHGVLPSDDLRAALNLEELFPGDEAEQRFQCQVWRSFAKRRVEVVKEKASSSPPAVLNLNMCAVDPAFQRRAVATRLVQWGLDEAQRRGGLEAITEASSMGREVYVRLGFKPEGGDIEYIVDDEFKDRVRVLPPNVFMRTGHS
ncbi:hypothetical protein F4778DRAFT_254100 [Xylariomycetidae sp. FL2044]|nr:hypothetical protein F4778DRAFT_254100 [Xylariomycetidae sp. FL2044]